MQETWVQSLGREDPLKKETATHSSILAMENSKNREAWWATYSPWGLKESDMTEQLTHTHTTQRQQGNLGESYEMKQKKRIIKY